MDGDIAWSSAEPPVDEHGFADIPELYRRNEPSATVSLHICDAVL